MPIHFRGAGAKSFPGGIIEGRAKGSGGFPSILPGLGAVYAPCEARRNTKISFKNRQKLAYYSKDLKLCPGY